MEYYITHSLFTCSPKNKKQADMIEYITAFENLIIEGQIGYDALKQEISSKVDLLNALYSKTKMVFRDRSGVFEVFIPGANSDLDNHIFYLHVDKAKGVYWFAENIPLESRLTFRDHFGKSLKSYNKESTEN